MCATIELFNEIFSEGRKNRKWLEKNYKKLVKKYPEEFVFIYK